MDKQVLREVYKRIRLSMSQAEVKTKSRMISRRLIADADWSEIKIACVYIPISKLNEVDISSITLLMEKHGISVYPLGASKNEALPEEKFDLIIVPCLAFDKDNYRLGWGGGFYDRFLEAQPQSLKIGLCFQSGFVQEGLPIEPHDVKLDMIITEEKVYKT